MFVLEVPRMLETIETELVTISQNRSGEKVHKLMRAAHSIKGGAASLGLAAITDLAHQAEDIFRVLKHPELPFDSELESLLFALYDSLHQVVTAEIKQQQLPAHAHTKTEMVLANLDDAIGHFVIVGQQIPDEVDVVQSIFTVDVADSLVRLERVLTDPESASITVGEFRAQAEVFIGISRLVMLPGFGRIAQTVILALDRHPDRALEICHFALADFQAAVATVLDGDRTVGGAVSEGFAALVKAEPRVLVAAGTIGADLFDLEDLFDRELVAGVNYLAVSSDLDLFTHEFDLIADYLNLPMVAAITDVAPAVSIASVGRQLVQLDYFDYPLEEILAEPAITVFLPEVQLGFDLVDIFELPVHITPINIQAFSISGDLPTMMAAIATNFDHLPLAKPADLSTVAILPPVVVKPTRIKRAKKVTVSATPQLSVRVAVDRLKRMNNLVGELVIERHGLALHNEQLHHTLTKLRAKCENFQTISDRMRQLADEIIISDRGTNWVKDQPSRDFDHQFDVLELDRYSQLHYIAQETLEQLAQIEEQIDDLSLFSSQSHRQIDRQKQVLSYLRDDLMWSRMLPLGEILNRFPRTLHDLSTEFNKPVDLKITGAGVLVDKVVIEKLLDPLVHLLRNAFDHGIDPPNVRQQQGKPERGLIEITAYHQGSQTVIEVRDDGQGIDLDRVKAKGLALGLLPPGQADTASEDQILDLLFQPGFSTAAAVTKLSGRGMGLDIVKEQIQMIKGKISIQSQIGRGTTFSLCIPLTLTIAQLMVCQVGNATYAFPSDSIKRIVVPTATQLQIHGDQPFLHWKNLIVPIHNLVDILTYTNPPAERPISQMLKAAVNNPTDWLAPILLIQTGERIVALQIDRLITEQELTVKPFGKAIRPPSYSYGCTILGDGSILPVLDLHALILTTIDRPQCTLSPSQLPPSSIAKPVDLILVVDDSVTSRQSLSLTLEKYGYRTLQAKDGQEALQLLRQKAAELKLVICDVEMPNMNGFEFLNVRRQDATLTHVPVVMLTSRSNDKHRQFATHLGAIDYFIKPYVETDFMISISKIITPVRSQS